MGQLIEVTATRVGDVAVFALDRSLTGQDSATFAARPEGSRPPELLAQRLFDSDAATRTVHILSNTVTVGRETGWDDATLGSASDIISKLFVHYEPVSTEAHDEALREENYNATITWIRAHNPDLWVIRIKPDQPFEPFEPGQYTHLGLGYWEPRADDASEDFDPHSARWDRMARRAYSVSSSMVDDDGDLLAPASDEVEFYIVRVPPHLEDIPALTPRLFRKSVDDRLYMSSNFTGHYTLEGVGADDNVVFLATGTGEAPHNLMAAALARSGHRGRILSVCCVRFRADLAYLEQHAALESALPTYRYVALTTREPENVDNKVYIQDYINSGRAQDDLGVPLDPEHTHVFLCGNPLMIGLPTWEEDEPTFPEPLGVCEILHGRGFTIDHRGVRGNVHYEEYWKER